MTILVHLPAGSVFARATAFPRVVPQPLSQAAIIMFGGPPDVHSSVVVPSAIQANGFSQTRDIGRQSFRKLLPRLFPLFSRFASDSLVMLTAGLRGTFREAFSDDVLAVTQCRPKTHSDPQGMIFG